MGGHLDVHWHARNLHFTLPALRSVSADDRNVGNKNCRAGSRRAFGYNSWRKGAHTMMRTPAGHQVYAMAAEYPSAAALYEAAKRVRDAGFRRWDVFSPDRKSTRLNSSHQII